MTPAPDRDRAPDPGAPALVADIGGTNTRVALADGARVRTASVRHFRNGEHAGIERVLARYLADANAPALSGTCVALAGPVRDGAGELTNHDWRIDRPALARGSGAERVALLNDLQAQGHALGHLAEGAERPVLDGPSSGPHAAKLVIGVGTGFNAAPVYDTAAGRFVPPSEAGHSSLPLRSEADLRLARSVEAEAGFPGVEEVLSGRGLERIFAWLGEEADDRRTAKAADIMAALREGGDARAEAAARRFARLFGTIAGDLALINLPFGGVYLSGGVARAFAPWLCEFGFDDAFRDKGRFAGFMENFAVTVIEDDDAALTGCAAHLANLAAMEA